MAIRARDAAAARWTRPWGSLSPQERRSTATAWLTEAAAVPATHALVGARLLTRIRAPSSPATTWPASDRAEHLAGLRDVDSGRSPARALRHDAP